MRELPYRPDGAEPSFEEYHRGHRDDLLALARSIVGREAAEDAAQDAWVLAWREWGRARAEGRDDWMASLLRRGCEARQRAGQPAPVPVCEEDGPCRSFEDEVVAALQVSSVWTLLGSFPSHLRDVLFLRGALDLSYAEIAELQQVPMGTVMSRLHEARRRARARLRNSRKIEYPAPAARSRK